MRIGALALALLALTPAALFGQLDRGTFSGAVTDSSAGVIPKSQVTATNQATQATYKTETNDLGQYTLRNVPAGTYDLIFEAEGFKKAVRGGIKLGVADVLRVDTVLEIGSVSESVEVTAEVPRLQTESPEVSTTLGAKALIDMPFAFGSARIVENLAYKLAPGLSGGSYTSHINGSASFSKEVLLDGATISVYRPGDFGQGSVSIEAVQEFKVQASGMSAEYGRTQSGVFNFVMKSGSNALHGSAYVGLRNEALNANTFANNASGARRQADRKKTFAGSFGGPVYIPKVYDGHNKTFFYATWEQFKEKIAGFRAPDRTVPLAEMYEGDLSKLLGASTGQVDALGRQVYRGAIYDPQTFRQLANGSWIGDMFPGNKIPTSRFSQVSRNVSAIAKQHYLPTARDGAGNIPLVNNSTFPVSSQPDFAQYQFSAKADHNFNSNHKLSGSYSWIERPRLLLDQGGMWDITDPMGGPFSKARSQPLYTHMARAAYDWVVTPTILNHVNIHLNRRGNPNDSVHVDVDGAKELGIKNLSTTGYPNINWGGGPVVSFQNPGDPQLSLLGSTGYGILDTVSFSKGRHFMKAGVDFRTAHLNTRGGPGGNFDFNALGTAIPGAAFSGNLTGHAFASFLLGIVHSAGYREVSGNASRRHYYAGFFQDDFKVSNKLTLQLGLRWEHQPPVLEAADRQASWSETAIDPISKLPGAYEFAGNCSACTGKRYFGRRDWLNFGPRIGFAYQPFPKWTIRSAYGIFYEADLNNGLTGAPGGLGGAFVGTYNLSADPIEPWRGIFNWDNGFPTNRYVKAQFDPSFGNFNNPAMVDPEYGRSPRTHQWNFNIQREIGWRTVVDVGYVGRTSTGLWSETLKRLNQIDPKYLAQFGAQLNNAVRSEADAARYGIKYPYPGFNGTLASALRPYPQVRANSTVYVYRPPLGFATHHALQVTFNKQVSNGLNFYGNYVWSKTMSNDDSSAPGDDASRPLDYYNLKLEKSISQFDQAHGFKASVDYELPIGRGKALLGNAGRLTNTMFGGWSIAGIVNYLGGMPLQFNGSTPLATGWNGAVNRANVGPGPFLAGTFNPDKFELSTAASPNNTYLNKANFSDPKPLTFGNGAPRYAQIRSFPTYSEEFSLIKNNRIGEGKRFQIRAEFLNLLNRKTFSNPNTSVTSLLFGQVTSVSNSPRTVQLAARLDF
jgi:hypothetical protein